MIPESIKVCGISYKVIWRPDKDMHGNIGETRYNECEIWLNLKYKEYSKRIEQVLLHEILHAISEELNCNLSEDQVNNMAVGIYETMQNLR